MKPDVWLVSEGSENETRPLHHWQVVETCSSMTMRDTRKSVHDRKITVSSKIQGERETQVQMLMFSQDFPIPHFLSCDSGPSWKRERKSYELVCQLFYHTWDCLALEPEAASIYCRRLRMCQLVPEKQPKQYFEAAVVLYHHTCYNS